MNRILRTLLKLYHNWLLCYAAISAVGKLTADWRNGTVCSPLSPLGPSHSSTLANTPSNMGGRRFDVMRMRANLDLPQTTFVPIGKVPTGILVVMRSELIHRCSGPPHKLASKGDLLVVKEVTIYGDGVIYFALCSTGERMYARPNTTRLMVKSSWTRKP